MLRGMQQIGVLIVSSLGTLFFGLLLVTGSEDCFSNTTCSQLRTALSHDNFAVFLIAVPVLLVSLATYRGRIEIFNAWKRFLALLIPVAVFATILIPDEGSFMWSDPKLSIAFLFSVVIFMGSIVVVIWKRRQFSK